MQERDFRIYSFENFRLDTSKRLLFNESNEPVALMPKAFEILLYLVSNSGRLIEKDELISAVWPDTIVEENNLTQNISALRKTLGEKHRENRFIVTVPGRGYKFVAEVRNSAQGAADDPLDMSATTGAIVNTPAAAAPVSHFWLYTLLSAVALGIVLTAFALWRTGPVYRDLPVRSLAVLPFKPVSPEIRDEPLEMGMADTLIMKLGGEELVVRPLSTVRRYGALDQDPLQAGRDLGVDAVLDGRIQIAGERVRITVTLFRVADGRQLWANSFDEQLTNIFSVQDSISDRVAVSLRLPLGHRDKRYTQSVEAYQLYMKGQFHISRLIRPEVEKGIEYLGQAVEHDPQYAMAYVAMANAYRALVLTGDAPALEIMPKSKAAAEKAVAIDPQLSESWTSLATSNFWFDFNWKAAEQNYKKAIDLDPNSAGARTFYAHLLSNIGRNEESLVEFKKARELDPINLASSAIEGQAIYFAGRDDESIAALKRVLEMDDRFWLAHLFLTRPLIRKGLYDEAIASAQAARTYSGGNAEALATIGYILAISGRRSEALDVQRQLETQAAQRYVPPYTLAQVPTALGERDRALTLLERSFDNRDALLVFLKIEPKWDSLRNEERFRRLMQKMNFE
jgi:serine/threonine-protein kinase